MAVLAPVIAPFGEDHAMKSRPSIEEMEAILNGRLNSFWLAVLFVKVSVHQEGVGFWVSSFFALQKKFKVVPIQQAVGSPASRDQCDVPEKPKGEGVESVGPEILFSQNLCPLLHRQSVPFHLLPYNRARREPGQARSDSCSPHCVPSHCVSIFQSETHAF